MESLPGGTATGYWGQSLKGEAVHYHGRLAVQQRVLPAYRAAFFDLLAGSCSGGLSVFAGQPRADEAISTTNHLKIATFDPARNLHFGRVSSPFYLCWQVGLLAWLQTLQPDALVLEANPRYLSSWLGAAWMRRRGKSVLGWGLGVSQVEGQLGQVRQGGRLRFLRQFNGILAYSSKGAQQYQLAGVPAERVFVATNAVSPPPTKTPPARMHTFGERAKILFVGRLQARKRIDLLLRACASLPEDIQPSLVVVGDGPASEEFQALAAQIYPMAEFPGARHGTELDPYFAQADLFVLPGTGGLAVQQAMGYGLPVIAAEGDGTQEDLVRPENGWQVRPGDLQSLQKALHEALGDVARLRKMGAESYRIVREEINIETMVRTFVKALQAVEG